MMDRANQIVNVLFIAALLTGVLFCGCAGAHISGPLGASVVADNSSASALLTQAAAGTLTVNDSMACVINAGDLAEKLHKAETRNWFAHVFKGDKSYLLTDQHYPPAVNELLAVMISRSHRATGAWAVTPPSQAAANKAAAQSLWDIMLLSDTTTNVTTHVTAPQLLLAKKLAVKRAVVKRGQVPPLAQLIQAKLPAGWLEAYNQLPEEVRDQVNQDLPIVASWAADQLAAWWNNYLAGDTVTGRVMVLDAVNDAQLYAAGPVAQTNVRKVIDAHVDRVLAELAMLKNIVLAGVPALLAAFGL